MCAAKSQLLGKSTIFGPMFMCSTQCLPSRQCLRCSGVHRRPNSAELMQLMARFTPPKKPPLRNEGKDISNRTSKTRLGGESYFCLPPLYSLKNTRAAGMKIRRFSSCKGCIASAGASCNDSSITMYPVISYAVKRALLPSINSARSRNIVFNASSLQKLTTVSQQSPPQPD